MSKEYKFRVLIDQEGDGEAFRDVEINSSQTFDVLHDVIIKAFKFSGGQMASFYVSDEDWNKGQEIGLMNMSEYGEDFLIMNETKIEDIIEYVGEKLLYVYDFLNLWCFYIDLVQINDIDSTKEYPLISLALGIAPNEDSKRNIEFSSNEDDDFYDDEDDFESEFNDEYDDLSGLDEFEF